VIEDCMNNELMRTQRLLLRPPIESDVEGLWCHVTDQRITEFLAWEPHRDKSDTLSMIVALREATNAGKGYHWIIDAGGHVAGLISLIDVRRKHRSWIYDRAELSYWLGPDYQGNGYATEAGRAIISFAFQKLRLHKVILGHADLNKSSERVALRLGFRKYAVERDAFCKEGVWHELCWYDLLASECVQLAKGKRRVY
jgi:RimJ/RimL family protein N-acetyltransferase